MVKRVKNTKKIPKNTAWNMPATYSFSGFYKSDAVKYFTPVDLWTKHGFKRRFVEPIIILNVSLMVM